jgi:integrase/recombinase XerC
VKQQLAAVRMLFDWLITGQVFPNNPATGIEGRTAPQARRRIKRDIARF